MTADRLLRLYPRAWRERYGAEFLDTVGGAQLRPQQILDIVSGAIDAHLSSDVRRMSAASSTPGGQHMLTALKAACGQTTVRMTRKDGVIGAGVMIGATFLLLAIGIWAHRSGYDAIGEMLKSIAFPVAMMASMPFWMLKGQPWRAQAVLVGGTTAMLVLIGYIATKI
jgi:hypothetical protein